MMELSLGRLKGTIFTNLYLPTNKHLIGKSESYQDTVNKYNLILMKSNNLPWFHDENLSKMKNKLRAELSHYKF